jgi:hypothetical protein
MKELKKALRKAQKAAADLLPYFPSETTDGTELKLVVQAAIELDKLEHRLQERFGKDWGK